MKKILSILAVLTLATACIYPYQPDLEDAPEGVLVVDGNLVIGEKSTVRIGYMTSLWPKSNGQNSGEWQLFSTRASVSGNAVHVWAEDDAGGRYEGVWNSGNLDPYASAYYYYYASAYSTYTIDLENAPADRGYRLCVSADGKEYTSDMITPLTPPIIKNITFKASKVTDKAEVTASVSLEGGPDATGYVLLSFDETWRFHADYYPEFEYDPRSNSVEDRIDTWTRYWCWKHVDNNRLIPVDFTGMTTATLKDYPFHTFSRYDNRNHHRYSLLLKARTVDKITYEYLSHLEESSMSGDNLFSPNPGEIAGNLRCETDPDQMVLGYVTVTRIASRRVYIGSQYYVQPYLSPYSLAYPPQYPKVPGGTCYRDFYEMGYQPLIKNTLPEAAENDDLGPYGWGAANCYDCIAAGGFQEKPDFWEE